MSEYPLCSCHEMWMGEGNHAKACPVVKHFKELEEAHADIQKEAYHFRDALVLAHKQSSMRLRSFDEYVDWLFMEEKNR